MINWNLISKIIEKLCLEIKIPDLDQLVKNEEDVTIHFVESLYTCLTGKELQPEVPESEFMDTEDGLIFLTHHEEKKSNLSSNTEVEETKTLTSIPSKHSFESTTQIVTEKVQKPMPQSLQDEPLHGVKIKEIKIRPLNISVAELRRKLS